MPRRRPVAAGDAVPSSSTKSSSHAAVDGIFDSGDNAECAERGEDDSDADFEPSGPSDESGSDSSDDDDVGCGNVGTAEHSASCTCLARFSAEELDRIRGEARGLDRRYKSGLVAGLVLAHLARDPPSPSPPPLPPRTVAICCLFGVWQGVLSVFSLGRACRAVRRQRRRYQTRRGVYRQWR